MAQELGRMERPSVERFAGKRKLLLVPLLYQPPAQAQDGLAILEKYWQQVEEQVESLESKLGKAKHLYHENLTEGGPQALKLLEGEEQSGYKLVQSRCQEGATLEATEDEGVLLEARDLQLCLMLLFASEKVARSLHDWFSESIRKRYEYVSKRIDETLQENEVGLLLINERHQVQFPGDLEVFYVVPPAQDEFGRWLRGWSAQQQEAAKAPMEGQEESPSTGGDDSETAEPQS